MAPPPATYRGRFAPSPTGPLHTGSLVAALAGFLEARVRGGEWRLRVEDIDTPRVVPGAADAQLRTLEALGLTWDGPVVVQSTRTEAYRDAFDELLRAGRLYGCTCTRGDWSGPYPGTCRRRAPPLPGDGTSAARFALTADDPLSFV
ncbi:tRNA glutamyl-Q(34) synthetase GluQRS, partial [bacterium]